MPFPKFRFLIAKFRTSAHDLEIERGRYTKPKTPVTDRVCKMCDLFVTEDEYHFLMICPHYQKERDESNNVYREEIGEESAESDQEKFIKIVSSKSYNMQLSLGSFLYNSIKKREAIYKIPSPV